MLKANDNGTFEPNLTDEEKRAVRRATAIMEAMAKVGLANNYGAIRLREFADEHCGDSIPEK